MAIKFLFVQLPKDYDTQMDIEREISAYGRVPEIFELENPEEAMDFVDYIKKFQKRIKKK